MKVETQNSAMAYRSAFAELDLSWSQSFVIKKKRTQMYTYAWKKVWKRMQHNSNSSFIWATGGSVNFLSYKVVVSNCSIIYTYYLHNKKIKYMNWT